MSNDLTKRTDPTKPERQKSNDAATRLKRELMADALDRLFGADESIDAPDKNKPPRVILALANHGHSPGWDRAKVLQRQMFDAAAGSDLEMKFAFYGPDDAAGVRRCRITTRWITDAEDMAGVMDRAECNCGCYVNIRDVLAQAVKEAEDRPLRAVIIVGDAFHDDPDGLDEAAISANRLRRAGTRVFLMQLGDDRITARKLEYLARVSGGAYFQFDPRTQERQFSEMWKAMSVYAADGEEAVKTVGGQAATLLLQHLKQEPMPIIEERVRVRVDSDIKERLTNGLSSRLKAGNRREDAEA
ncbi:MAG: hypothetical protein WAO08_32555 [Hyphomicrobiaceae bacterium]